MEMSGLLKELHCPYKELISGILKASVPNKKDHLKFVCTYSEMLLVSTVVQVVVCSHLMT